MTQTPIAIPYDQLSADALQGLLEEFVTRDGTDYGLQELALEEKVAKAMCALQRGDVIISFDPVQSLCQLVDKQDFERYLETHCL